MVSPIQPFLKCICETTQIQVMLKTTWLVFFWFLYATKTPLTFHEMDRGHLCWPVVGHLALGHWLWILWVLLDTGESHDIAQLDWDPWDFEGQIKYLGFSLEHLWDFSPYLGSIGLMTREVATVSWPRLMFWIIWSVTFNLALVKVSVFSPTVLILGTKQH